MSSGPFFSRLVLLGLFPRLLSSPDSLSVGTSQNQGPFTLPLLPPMPLCSHFPGPSWPCWALSPLRPCPRPLYKVTPAPPAVRSA